jgi:hypothetical protein
LRAALRKIAFGLTTDLLAFTRRAPWAILSDGMTLLPAVNKTFKLFEVIFAKYPAGQS